MLLILFKVAPASCGYSKEKRFEGVPTTYIFNGELTKFIFKSSLIIIWSTFMAPRGAYQHLKDHGSMQCLDCKYQRGKQGFRMDM